MLNTLAAGSGSAYRGGRRGGQGRPGWRAIMGKKGARHGGAGKSTITVKTRRGKQPRRTEPEDDETEDKVRAAPGRAPTHICSCCLRQRPPPAVYSS